MQHVGSKKGKHMIEWHEISDCYPTDEELNGTRLLVGVFDQKRKRNAIGVVHHFSSGIRNRESLVQDGWTHYAVMLDVPVIVSPAERAFEEWIRKNRTSAPNESVEALRKAYIAGVKWYTSEFGITINPSGIIPEEYGKGIK
jgi:hypothetical protein